MRTEPDLPQAGLLDPNSPDEGQRLHAEIVRLREDIDDLRASATRWRQLYDGALQRAIDQETAVRRTLPEECPFCGSRRIQLETTMRGSTASWAWCCGKCGRDWSVGDGRPTARR
jgi:hypothetical protein